MPEHPAFEQARIKAEREGLGALRGQVEALKQFLQQAQGDLLSRFGVTSDNYTLWWETAVDAYGKENVTGPLVYRVNVDFDENWWLWRDVKVEDGKYAWDSDCWLDCYGTDIATAADFVRGWDEVTE